MTKKKIAEYSQILLAKIGFLPSQLNIHGLYKSQVLLAFMSGECLNRIKMNI